MRERKVCFRLVTFPKVVYLFICQVKNKKKIMWLYWIA